MRTILQPITEFDTAHTIESYPDSLQRLIRILSQTPRLTPTFVKEIVLNSKASPQDLMPWADFDHPIADSYGRKLVFDGGHFEIMVMSWAPGDFSAIHDHGATQWGAVQCFGAAEHYLYRWQAGVLSSAEPAHYHPGAVCAVSHTLIHQMGNSGDIPFLSLHVYGCSTPQPSITGDARIFDLLEGSIQYTNGGVFFCLPEAQINRREPGVAADLETTLRHHYQMRDRLARMLKAQYNPKVNETLSLLQSKIQKLDRYWSGPAQNTFNR